ncbi:arsenate reductase (glutaredoxin) [Membranihabitans maritimus]|uniref:arsenate reductase (glutaredoxin) n=1 Tax=Membranihabitans maritimus TaxID=2904244 RepID=UPI001EEDF57E|nr:arsenate reductase (glutaredoxin) [Membranihabitans maritimus]
MELYHNPRCQKSRETLKLLEEKGVKFEIRKYLEDTPDRTELKEVIDKLGIPAEELVRKTEKIYKSNFKGKDLSEDEWIKAMVENPKLIQRPILIKGSKAAIGRPPETVLEIL